MLELHPKETQSSTPPVTQPAPMPELLGQSSVAATMGATSAVTSPSSDSVANAVLVTLGISFAAWLLNFVQAPLLGVLASKKVISASAFPGILQGLGFVETILFAVLIGYLLGRVTPRNYLPGLLIGRGVAFVVGFLWSMAIQPLFMPPSIRSDMPRLMLMSLPMSLFWLVTITITEALIAYWIARRIYGPLK